MEYVVAIPSYHRSETCRTKTLAMLAKHQIPKNKIHVYIVREDENEYTKFKSEYGHLVIGKKGLVQQREFIMNQFHPNKYILFLDDDIESIDLSLSKFKTLDQFIHDAFRITKENNAFIWGVYPVFNPFFRKARSEMTTCLNYIVGAFYGIINRPLNKRLALTLTKENGQKEDVERTIKYFIEDGLVVRFNRVGFVTKYYGKTGGLGTFEDRLKPMKVASELLQRKYPEYGSILTKKNGMTEFRLKKHVGTKIKHKGRKTRRVQRIS